MALILEPSLHAVSNASESLERCSGAPNAKPRRANHTQIQGAGANATCLLDLLLARPTRSLCPGCGNLLNSDPVTLKQKPIRVWAVQQWDGNFPANLADNYLNKFPWKTQISQTTPWSPNLNQAKQLHLQIWSLEWNYWYWLQGIKAVHGR